MTDKIYYDAVTEMEKMQVDKEYALGWMGGYLHNPPREEQKTTQAYEAGYEDGSQGSLDKGKLSQWIKKS